MWWHSQQMCSFLAPPSCNFYIICHQYNSFHLPKYFPKPPAFNTLDLPAPTPLASCRTLCDPCVCNALRAVVVAAVLARCGVGCYVQTYSYLSYLFHLRHPPHLEHSLARSNFETVCACVAAAPFAARAARVLDATASVVVHGILIQPLQQSLFDVMSYLLSLTSPHLSSPPLPLSLILLLLFHPRRLSRRSSSSRRVTTQLAAMVQRLCTIQR